MQNHTKKIHNWQITVLGSENERLSVFFPLHLHSSGETDVCCLYVCSWNKIAFLGFDQAAVMEWMLNVYGFVATVVIRSCAIWLMICSVFWFILQRIQLIVQENLSDCSCFIYMYFVCRRITAMENPPQRKSPLHALLNFHICRSLLQTHF